MAASWCVTRWVATTPEQCWQEKTLQDAAGTGQGLALSGEKHQTWEGFGGCFNELGWIALSWLDDAARDGVIRALFDPQDGCRFTFCRTPIGASDYGAEWYSLNETDGDFAMEHFSIARDTQYLIPFIRAAMGYQADLKLFASPWSPPTWMKFPKAYNYGTFIMKSEYLDAYARYFQKFVEAYAAAGIPIHQVHVQNEPVADQKFPSCVWTGEQLRVFMRDYLGPRFRKMLPDCEVWLGTLNTEDYDAMVAPVMFDDEARQYVDGIGLQWAGKGMVQRIQESWANVPLMQTENECGEGSNDWGHARHVFNLLRHYISNGVNSYCYWNMVLQPWGTSTWGWKQNAMVTIDEATKAVTLNPEFYVMKHFSGFIAPGAVRLGLTGPWTGNAVAFENPDGSIAVVVANHLPEAKVVTFGEELGGMSLTLQPGSVNTLTFQK